MTASSHGPIVVNLVADDSALDAFAEEDSAFAEGASTFAEGASAFMEGASAFAEKAPSPNPMAQGTPTAEFADELVHAYPTEARDATQQDQPDSKPPDAVEVADGLHTARGEGSTFTGQPVQLDPATLRALFDVTLQDTRPPEEDRLHGQDWGAAWSGPTTARAVWTPDATAVRRPPPPASRFVFDDRIRDAPVSPRSVRIDSSRSAQPFSWLRAVSGVAILVAIGLSIAVGTRYLPLTGRQTIDRLAEIVRPERASSSPEDIAAQSLPVVPSALPVAPSASPALTSPQQPATALPTTASPTIGTPIPPAQVPPARAESTPERDKPLVVPPPAREPYLRVDRAGNDTSVPTAASVPREAPPVRPSTTPTPVPSPQTAVAEPSVVQPSRDVTPPRDVAPPRDVTPPPPAPPQPAASAPTPAPVAPQPAVTTPRPAVVADATPPAARAAEPSRPVAPNIPEVSAVQRDETDIRRLLDDYRQAYGRLDAARTASLWPGVDTAALSRAFSTIARQEVEFEQCAVEVNGQRAAAKCRGSLQYVRRVGNTSPQSRSMSWTFVFDRSSGRWLINRVTAQ